MLAYASPISNHILVSLCFFRNRPAGSMIRILLCIPAAMRFLPLFVFWAEYYDFLEWTRSLNCTFPAWLLIRLPRPPRTLFSFRSVIRASFGIIMCFATSRLSWQSEHSVASPSANAFLNPILRHNKLQVEHIFVSLPSFKPRVLHARDQSKILY